MKKIHSTLLLIAAMLIVQSYSYASIVDFNPDLLAYSYNIDIPEYSSINLLYNDLSIAGIVNDDFTLEQDIDIESKKRIRPKANILNGFKVEDDNSSKCVEKIINPKLKKERIKKYDVAEDDVENLDIDKVDDVKALTKRTRKPKIAKTEKKERISWFNIFKRKSKTETVAMQNTMPDIEDIDKIDNSVKNTTEPKLNESIVQSPQKIEEETIKAPKVKEERVTPVKVAEAKPEKVKPVKAPKVKEERVKPVKIAEAKPEKVKPVKAPKVKEERVKPVKIAEAKPEKIKPVKAPKVKEERVKPVKIAEAKPEKVKPAEVKTLAASSEIPEIEDIDKVESNSQQLAENNAAPENGINNALLSKEVLKNTAVGINFNSPKKAETTLPKVSTKQNTEKHKGFNRENKIAALSQTVNMDLISHEVLKNSAVTINLNQPKQKSTVKNVKEEHVTPVKIAEAKPEKVKPVKAPKVKEERVKPVKIAEAKPEKVKPVKAPKVKEERVTPVKIAEAKPEKVKPVKAPKAKEERVKPVKIAEAKPEKVKPVKAPKVKEERVKPVKIAEAKPEKVKPVKAPKVKEERVKPVKIAEAKPEKVKPVKAPKVKEERVKPVKVAKVHEPKTKPVKVATVKQKPVRIEKESNIKPVSELKTANRTVFRPTTGKYSVVLQETPVSNSFEQLQSRLPLTRRPFDNEDI